MNPVKHGQTCMCGGEFCGRPKPLREQLQELVNNEQVRIAQRGIEGIDALKNDAVRKLKARGIHDVDGMAGDLASFAKRLLLRGFSR